MIAESFSSMGVSHEHSHDRPQPVPSVAALPDPRHVEQFGPGQNHAICGHG